VDKASSCENPPEGLSGMRQGLDLTVSWDVSESTACDPWLRCCLYRSHDPAVVFIV